MGLLDDVLGAVGGKSGGEGGKAGMMDAIGGLLGGGGIGGLVEQFTKGGLGEAVGSWIGTGSNLPVSAEQIQSVLGNEQVKSIAAKLGLSTEDASKGIASLLPQVVDKLTPDGKVPDNAPAQDALGGILKNLGF